MNIESKWFNPDKIFSYNALINFVVGARGCGKTYGMFKWAIKRFLKTGKKFIYLRRFKDELKGDEIETLFDKVAKDKDFKGLDIFVKGRRFYIEDKQFGQIMFLSVQQGKKGLTYDDYDLIFFDEFIIEKGYQHYLPEEPIKLYGFLETIFRDREGCRCICCANSVVWVNPYFLFYKFVPIDSGFELRQEGTVLLNVYKNEIFNEEKSKTRFAKMIKGTSYEDVSMNNIFSDVNDDFIKKKSKDSILSLNIKWKDKIYGVWYDNYSNELIVSNKYNPDERTVCYTSKDLKPNMMLITDTKNNINRELKRAVKNNYLFFEDVYIRNDIFDLFSLMGIR